MIALGRTLWIASAGLFFLVAVFYPTTVSTDTRLGDIINIPRVRVQLLLALAFVAGFVAGVVLDAVGTAVAGLRPASDGAPGDTSAPGAVRTATGRPPLLRRDADGEADVEHLAELGIVRTADGWTLDGVPMPDWSTTINRAIWANRLRLR